jgi:hypothetical protein
MSCQQKLPPCRLLAWIQGLCKGTIRRFKKNMRHLHGLDSLKKLWCVFYFSLNLKLVACLGLKKRQNRDRIHNFWQKSAQWNELQLCGRIRESAMHINCSPCHIYRYISLILALFLRKLRKNSKHMPKTKIGAFFSDLWDFKHRRRFIPSFHPPYTFPPA